jgi:alanine-glyoxylate transaminase / serine-glyoxylate transaminase / serine-pyruvate transaminase
VRAPLDPPEVLLLGPGPSNPDPVVSRAMAAPLVGHLDPYFLTVMEETMSDLRKLFRTDNHHTIPISSTGTGGLETIVFNLVEPGDDVIVGVIGHFGQRLCELASAAGATVRPVEVPWGGVIDPAQIAAEFGNGPAKLVALVHAETSTGAAQPLADIGRIVRENDSLLMVDAVTSLGGMNVDVEGWMIDAAGSCSQKCIGAPPGSGPITVGPRAIDAIKRRTSPVASWYFDIERLFRYWGEGGSTHARAFHHTAPVANIYGFREALRLIHEEGMETRFERHQEAHTLFVELLSEIGFDLFTPAEHRLPMLNVVNVPDGVDDAGVRKAMRERGIEIGGAFGPLAGKAWRIGLMGANATVPVVHRLVDTLSEVVGRRP